MNELEDVPLGCTIFVVLLQLLGALRALECRLRGTPPVTLNVRQTMGRRWLMGQVVSLACIVAMWRAGAWTLADVGASTIPLVVAFVVGVILYFALTHVVQLLYTIAGYEHLLSTLPFESLRDIYPRSKRQKCMFAIGMVLNPITEEWFYRGVLVTWVYTRTDSVWSIVAAVIASVMVHVYQKPSALPCHLLFAIAACGIVLSPLGYAGAVGLHMAGDIYPLAMMKGALYRWKRTARARKVTG